MNDKDDYLEWMNKSASGVCPVCEKPYSDHDYPTKTPCPKCNSIEHVDIWEAWGHPNGDLYCQECTGFFTNEIIEPYWTFRVVNGKPKIIPWTREP